MKAVTCPGQEIADRSSTSTEPSFSSETQDIKDMRELKGALLEMIDQVHAPEEFPSLLLTLAGVFVDSIDEEKKEKVFTRFCLSQRDFDAKVTDIELRANLLAVLKRTLSPAVPISISQKVSRKRDKTQA